MITRKELLRIGGVALLGGVAGKAAKALGGAESAPAAAASGPRWGMVVDIAACEAQGSCRQCLLACKRAHNVPDIPDPKQRIDWIDKAPSAAVLPFRAAEQDASAADGPTVPVLCNHCASPPCVRVCPTQATFKREDGIVMMDFHRCIGCRYCMAACPYGARSFNFIDPRPYVTEDNQAYPTRTAGVVEKCDFCAERLAWGGTPACVEACPAKALSFGNLNDEHSAVRALLRARPAVQRRPELGLGPAVFYVL